MSDILSAAKAQFSDRLAQPLREITVPEWIVDGKPAVIYFKPSMTFKQQGEILGLASQGKHMDTVVTTFILRALDANGTPLFKKVQKPEIINEMDPDVIARIVGDMNDEQLTVEDMEKN